MTKATPAVEAAPELTSAAPGTTITSNDAVADTTASTVEYHEDTLADGTVVRTFVGVDPFITGRISSN
ncbi:hypothetical protein [Caulobacter sp.]|uniref:hypothetical protein n=1 Tax=Caulobacter sp. TaxID=78 RepID=UPI0031D0B18B